jgi:hypothetical protein
MAASEGDGGQAITLEWVLGCSTGPSSVHALAARPAASGEGAVYKLLYLSGNVGVIYDTEERNQVLLRGHVSYAPVAFKHYV